MKSNLSPPLFSEPAQSIGSPPAAYEIGRKEGYEFPKQKNPSLAKTKPTNMTLPGKGTGRINIERMTESQFGPSRAGATEAF